MAQMRFISGGRNTGFDRMPTTSVSRKCAKAYNLLPRYGAKVFVATNIYAHEEDLAGIADYLKQLESVGIAAIITADPAIVETAQLKRPGWKSTSAHSSRR